MTDAKEVQMGGKRASPAAHSTAVAMATVPWWREVPLMFLIVIVACFSCASIAFIGLVKYACNPTLRGPHSQEMLLTIGIVNSLMGSLQTASGYCSQRLGHQLTARYEAHGIKKKNPFVKIGILLLAGGTVNAIVNLGLLGQSVTAPFAAMTLISNGILARTVLREKITRFDVFSTILVLMGVAIAMVGVGMADMVDQAFSIVQLEHLFFRSALPVIYTAFLVLLLTGFYTFVRKNNLSSCTPGLCCYSIGTGVLSGFTTLGAKCTIELLKNEMRSHTSDFRKLPTYLVISILPIAVYYQLKFMSLGLRHFGTLKFVPPYHALIIISNLVNGMVYLNEFEGYDLTSALLFLVGCIVTVGGVLLLLLKVSEDDHDPVCALDRQTGSTKEKDLATVRYEVEIADCAVVVKRGDLPQVEVIQDNRVLALEDINNVTFKVASV